LSTQTGNELDQILDQIEKQGGAASAAALGDFVTAIAKQFRLQVDEVAILEIVPPGYVLRFVVPEKLSTTGSIPLNSSSAQAARTARSRRFEILNNFSTQPHATVFEGVPLGRRQEESIHKMLSGPILRESRVIGVVQLCRKGANPHNAGPDFDQDVVSRLRQFIDVLARFLSLARPTA
jgi:hypothetical protein